MKKILILTLAFLLTFGVNVFAADTEVPDLTSEMTAVAAGDLLYITDTSDTGSSNKITVNNLFDHIDTSAELKTILTDEEGSGFAVFATSPTLTTPILTTPTMTDPILGNATATTLIATTGTMDIVGNVTGDLTGSSTETASNADWTIHDSYPADCTNQFVRGLGDTNTCETVVAADVQLLKDIVTTAPLTGAEDNVLVGVDSDLTLAITVLKDLVTTAPLTGGTDNILTGSDADITIAMPVATTSADGYLSQTDWDTFNDKVDNVSTNLSEGTSTTTTVNVNSSDGTNATLVSASTSRAGLLTKAKFDEVVVNSTHSADNTQAHSDYLLNNASDTMTGLLTTTGGLITSASITINSDTSRLYMGATADASTYFDGTDWWFVSPTEAKKASDIGSGSGAGGWVGTATSNLDMDSFAISNVGGLVATNSITIDSDSARLYLGDGQDASIYYDATDLHYDSQVVGSGDHIFDGGDVRTAGAYYGDGSNLSGISAGGNKQVCFIFDGGGAAVSTGEKAWVRATNSYTITGMDITGDQSGSAVVDIWKDTYANYPPTNADSICDGGTCPTLSGAIKGQDTTLTSWTTSVTAGDYLLPNVDSAATVEKLEVCIYGS